MHRNTDRMEMNDHDIKSRLFGDISNSVVLELFIDMQYWQTGILWYNIIKSKKVKVSEQTYSFTVMTGNYVLLREFIFIAPRV